MGPFIAPHRHECERQDSALVKSAQQEQFQQKMDSARQGRVSQQQREATFKELPMAVLEKGSQHLKNLMLN